MKKKIPSTCTWGPLLDLLFTSYGYLQVSKWNIDIWSWKKNPFYLYMGPPARPALH